MVRWLHNFWLDEQGQDLTEYSMLIAFIVVLCLAFVFTGTSSVSGIWTQTNSRLVAANSVTGGS